MKDFELYASKGLKAVQDSDFLSIGDWQALAEMQDELQDTFEKKQMWRTETEMHVSVLNDVKFPTPSAKYWQAVREQDVFFTELVALSFEYRRTILKIEVLQRDIAEAEDEYERRGLQIDIEEALFKKRHMEVAARNRVRELRLWSSIKAELEPGVVDPADVNTHQLVSYAVRFLQELHSLSDKTSFAEQRNLIGLAQTALKQAKEADVLPLIYEQAHLSERDIKLLERKIK